MGQWDLPKTLAGARVLVAAGRARGLSTTDCVAGTGVAPSALDDPTAEIMAWQEVAIARNIVGALGDEPGLGLEIGTGLHLTSYGTGALAALSSPTLRHALELSARYSCLTHSLCRTRFHSAAGRTSIDFDGRALPPEVRRLLVERDIGAVVIAARELLGRDSDWMRVEIEFHADGAEERYRRVLGTTPVFDAGVTRIVVSDPVLDTPLPQADPHTLRVAERDCVDLVARRRARATVAGQVVDRLRAAGHGMPSLDQVAAALLTTRRTLGRRLAAEGTSFRTLVDQVRLGMALELLAAANPVSIEQVAEALGYAEPSAFTHAFRRWTGVAPRVYRESVRDTTEPGR
jgi:AraC-like DNA-binding protein